MESSVNELIRNLNQTIDQLTKENEKLKKYQINNFANQNLNNNKIIQRTSNDFSNIEKNSFLNIKPNIQSLQNLSNNYLNNVEQKSLDHSDYIISKSLDLVSLIKREIIQLLDEMKKHHNTSDKLLNVITTFIQRNRVLISYNESNKAELILKIKQRIASKIANK